MLEADHVEIRHCVIFCTLFHENSKSKVEIHLHGLQGSSLKHYDQSLAGVFLFKRLRDLFRPFVIFIVLRHDGCELRGYKAILLPRPHGQEGKARREGDGEGKLKEGEGRDGILFTFCFFIQACFARGKV